jgi:hypothetical protein
MSKIMPGPQVRETVKEGAAEVRAKLKQDISQWSRARRLVTITPTIGCMECDATGKLACSACGGSGTQKVVWNDEQQACPTCEGHGTVTCVECAGQRRIPNKHRKKIIWVLALGGLAWAFALYTLFKPDIAPELRARYLGGGGGGYSTGRPKPATPAVPGGENGTTPGSPGSSSLTNPNNDAFGTRTGTPSGPSSAPAPLVGPNGGAGR